MKGRKYGKPIEELPDELRDIIRREVEDGLVDFGAEDFERAVKARLRPELMITPRRFSLLKVAPAVGLALAVVTIGAAILWLARTSPSPPGHNLLALSLQHSPGLTNLREYPLPYPSADGGRISPAADLVGRALSFAAAEASAPSRGPAPGGPIKPVPRTSLEQKMKLLYGDRTIERALESFRDKFKEV